MRKALELNSLFTNCCAGTLQPLREFVPGVREVLLESLSSFDLEAIGVIAP